MKYISEALERINNYKRLAISLYKIKNKKKMIRERKKKMQTKK
jgi:hypothetical protein